jgi:hypothetical protein
LAQVRVALDQANGLRDVAGNPTTKTMYLVAGPAAVDRDVEGNVTRVHGNVLATRQRGGSVTSDVDVIVGDDGMCALALADELDEISAQLGKTVRGVAIPSRGALVAEAQLPVRVRAEVARRRTVAMLEKSLGIARRNPIAP